MSTQQTTKKSNSTLLWVLVVIFLFLFLLTTVLLGSRLYQMATLEQYSTDMEVGLDSQIDLFKIEYANADGEITVEGVNGENVVAPGTEVNYDIRLRNRDEVVIDFVMTPQVRFLSEDTVPIHFRLMDSYGNYVVGDETHWVSAEEISSLAHKGQIHPGDIFTYHLQWEWIFEVSGERDEYDTYLGNEDGPILPGVEVSFLTESTASPNIPTHSPHNTHLWGENFGCCWCCYLVWLLLIVVLALLFWVYRLKKKLRELSERVGV